MCASCHVDDGGRVMRAALRRGRRGYSGMGVLYVFCAFASPEQIIINYQLGVLFLFGFGTEWRGKSSVNGKVLEGIAGECPCRRSLDIAYSGGEAL